MPRFLIGKAAVNRIHAAVETLFRRTKERLLGRRYEPKKITVEYKAPQFRHDLSLPGIFDAASAAEGMKPNEAFKESLVRVAESYLDAHEQMTKARIVAEVQNFLTEAEAKGVDTDVPTVLGGKLYDVMTKVTTDVKRIVETESTRARNMGTMDAIIKVAALSGTSDPAVFFVVVRDSLRCDECTRLHLLEDQVTPRVYRLSEVSHSYHKRGDPMPSAGGLHPHCRCTMVYLSKGYGFEAGRVKFISLDHDEFARQRAA